MLLNLVITNFAIIDRLEVQFENGLTVLTGETGAGKSIILDAFGLLLGDRARPDLVRAGTDEATVEAMFDLEALPGVRTLLEDAGLPSSDELILRRVVQAGGRSRAYVNGTLVTLAQLQPLAEQLVTVCGQHEHQSLMQRSAHLSLLDHHGRLAALADDYREKYRVLSDMQARLDTLETAERDRTQRLEFLQHQSDEIAAAELSVEEEASLLAERLLLQNAERLAGISQGGYDALYGDDGAVCEILGRLADELQSAGDVAPDLKGFAETVRRSLYELEDVASQLRSQLSAISFEPGRQEVVEERLAELTRLKRKYAPDIAEILAMKVTFDDEIEMLTHAEEAREELTRGIDVQKEAVLAVGADLSQQRQQTAQDLSESVVRELNDLAMPGARFDVMFEPLVEPGPDGLDKVEFQVSPNPGEPLMMIGKVASGGELSRLMLALKRIAPDVERVPTVIFDEVDAGIGGATATAVGRKLKAVSQEVQVLCVTHLPQVAAFADQHHHVEKQEADGRTLAQLSLLNGEARVEEMARMLGGAQVSERTLSHARELIEVSKG